MLTKRPSIVYAYAPKRIRHKAKAAALPKGPVIVETRDPRRIKRKPAPAGSVVDHGKVEDISEAERNRRADAADQLLQEIKRAVAKQR